jgi:L-threonylcarbamoyladenylate synthase
VKRYLLSQENLRAILKEVGELLRLDKVGAIPTETFYGLACNPFSQQALERLVAIKGREEGKPILLLLGRLDDLLLVAERVPPLGLKLIKLFWPGPLTLVLPAKKNLPELITAGTGTVGVRLSSLKLTRKVAQAFGGPITGTSANKSNEPAISDPEELLKKLPDLDFILDAGKTEGKTPSTVVFVVKNRLELIREGVIPFEEIKRKLAEA